MIKARSKDLIIFGLSDENLERMQSGQPMMLDLNDIGLPYCCCILHGRTEEAILESLRSLIGPQTQVLDMSKKPN